MSEPIAPKLAELPMPDDVRLWVLQMLLFNYQSKDKKTTLMVTKITNRLLLDWPVDDLNYGMACPGGVVGTQTFLLSTQDMEDLDKCIDLVYGMGIQGVHARHIVKFQGTLTDTLRAHKEAGGD